MARQKNKMIIKRQMKEDFLKDPGLKNPKQLKRFIGAIKHLAMKIIHFFE